MYSNLFLIEKILLLSRNEQKTHTMRDTAEKLYIRLKMLWKVSNLVW